MYRHLPRHKLLADQPGEQNKPSVLLPLGWSVCAPFNIKTEFPNACIIK